MSNLVMIGTVPHEPLRLMGEAAKKAGSAATRLSRGDKFVEAGQGVAEQSAGRNITTSKNKIDVAISNNKRAINVMQVGGSIIEQASEIVNRAAKLARFASGNQVSDVDRKGYQTEFKGLMGQMESLGNFEYNGIKLFDGSRSGNTTISSNSGNNSVIYDLSSTSDFVSKGVSLNKNGVIAEASNFGITSAIGETHAEASVDIRGLKEVGSKLTVDNVVIEIVDANVVANNNGNNIQINAGSTASETFANILTALNGSDHETLSQFSYALEDKAVANLGSISNSSAATTFDATDKSMLKITANTTGSKFNDTWIAVANSKAIGSENAVEWTKFHSGYDKNTSGVSYAFEVDLSDKTANVSSNESFKINLGNGKEYEYIFVKNNDDAHKLAADKIAVQIGATLNESMINFANTVSGDTGDHLTTAEYIEKGNTGSLILTASLHSKYDTSYALDKDAYQFINNSTVKLSSYNGQTAVAGSSVAGGASKVLNGVSVGAGAGESNIMGFVSTKTVADLGTKTLTVYSGSTPTNDKALEINFDNSKAFAESGNVHTAATTTVDAYNTVTMGTSDLTDKAAFLEKLTNVLNKYEATGDAVFVLNDAKDGISLFDVSGATTTEFWVNGVEDTGTNIFTGIGGTINSGLVTTKSGIAGEATQVNIGTEQFDVVTIETGVTANTTANMKADEKNGMRVYLADQNNTMLV
ncbi:MAG: hypothetical protein OEY79_00825, partial [Anaplasmataceae bacterium]|nr:hypothetical protein [Anaplasmataceae bacterium]